MLLSAGGNARPIAPLPLAPPGAQGTFPAGSRLADPKQQPLTTRALVRFDDSYARCVQAGVPPFDALKDDIDTEWKMARVASLRIEDMRACIARLFRRPPRTFGQRAITLCNIEHITRASASAGRSLGVGQFLTSERYTPPYCRSPQDMAKLEGDDSLGPDLEPADEGLPSDAVRFHRENVRSYTRAGIFIHTLCSERTLTPSPGGPAIDAVEERLCRTMRNTQGRRLA